MFIFKKNKKFLNHFSSYLGCMALFLSSQLYAEIGIVSTPPPPWCPGTIITKTLTFTTSTSPITAASIMDVLNAFPVPEEFVSVTATPGFFSFSTPPVGMTGTVSGTLLQNIMVGQTVTVIITTQVSLSAMTGQIAGSALTAENTINGQTTGIDFFQSTPVSACSDLSISKNACRKDGKVFFTIQVSNNGPEQAMGVTVTDVLPQGVTICSVHGDGWVPTIQGQTVTALYTPTLAVGTATSTLTIETRAQCAINSFILNTATVSSANPDPNPSNNTASVAIKCPCK